MDRKVCIHASLALSWILPTEQSYEATSLLRRWNEAGAELISPSILETEVTSAIRKLTYLSKLSQEEAEQAYSLYRELDISMVSSPEVATLAWQLAKDYKLFRTYEAQYLAVAEIEHCELWSASARVFQILKDRNHRINIVGGSSRSSTSPIKKAAGTHTRPDFPGLWREI